MAYPSTTMNESQTEGYLSDVRNATLATIKRDGGPQMSSVWYLFEAGTIYIKFDAGSAKNYNIKRDSRVCFCVDGGADDSRTVTIYGDAEFMVAGDAETIAIKNKILVRYSDVENSGDDGSLLIAIKPSKIIALDYNG